LWRNENRWYYDESIRVFEPIKLFCSVIIVIVFVVGWIVHDELYRIIIISFFRGIFFLRIGFRTGSDANSHSNTNSESRTDSYTYTWPESCSLRSRGDCQYSESGRLADLWRMRQ